MRILVTGGTGVVGEAAVRALVARGHAVRLLSRHAERDARAWPDGVEAHVGDVTRPESLAGAADGCDAVLHVVGIVDESPPELTFERVNVEGTRHVVAESLGQHIDKGYIYFAMAFAVVIEMINLRLRRKTPVKPEKVAV